MRVFIASGLIIVQVALSGQNQAYKDYIEKYKNLAISEMQRTGIPASIKLSQALIESNAGRSELAISANNHFGIKCGGDWNGKTFHKEDDDFDEKGNLKKSCFRHFESAEESFIAHSEFLRNPAKMNRYGFLFQLPTTDYVGWAEGLKKAGYATSPSYAHTLIRVIEQYNLHALDQPLNPISEPVVALPGDKKALLPLPKLPKKVVKNNGIPMVFAQAGDTPQKIAERTGTKLERVLKSNELLESANQILPYGERVYLSPKKHHLRGHHITWHYVQAGESLYSISQLYGIKLKTLMSRNRLNPGEEPAVGTRVNIRRKIKAKDKPVLRSTTPTILPSKPEITTPDPEITHLHIDSTSNLDQNPLIQRIHKVEPGDTLYNISRKYGVTIQDLKSINKLQGDTIQIGQELIIY